MCAKKHSTFSALYIKNAIFYSINSAEYSMGSADGKEY